MQPWPASQRRTLGTVVTGLWIALLLAIASPAVAAPPANDLFAAGQVLVGDDVTATGSIVDATKETGEPNHAQYVGGSSVWYRWTPAEDRMVEVSLRGSDSVTTLAVYTGATVDGLTPIASEYYPSSYVVRFRAVAGQTYHLAVDRRSTVSSGSVSLSLSAAARPANDDLANARVLTGTSASDSVVNSAATREPGEPSHASYDSAGRTVWWTWTAPSTGAATFHLTGSGAPAVIAAYTGDTPSGLIRVASSGSFSKSGRIAFRAIAGTTYRIAIDTSSYYTPTSGLVAINLALADLPPNDAFVDAVDLGSGTTANTTGRNDGASGEQGEPTHYSYASNRSSVWYTWTAPSRGSLTLRADAGFPVVLAAYTGATVSSLTRVVNQPQDYNGGAEQIRIRVEAGQTYRIAVDATTPTNAGTFNLSLNLTGSPPNDDFADAQLLAGTDIEVDGTNVGATQEPGEPIHDDNFYDPSVWYSWTAPTTGGVTLDFAGSALDLVHGVYLGDAVATLTRVATTRSPSGTRTKRRFRAAAGVTYRIAIDGVRARMGTFHMALDSEPAPANDMFAAAEPLTGESATASGNNIGATGEAGEPNPGGTAGASVWYRYTAPSDGVLNVALSTTDFAASTAIYSGTAVGSLTSLGSKRAPVQAGGVYSIAVHGGSAAGRGTFTVATALAPAPPNDAFASASTLTGAAPELTGTTAGASTEPGEPGHCTYSSTKGSVWYSWTAPETGRATLDYSGSASYTAAGVYTGDSVDALTTVGRSADYSPYVNKVSFRVVAGTTYRIAMATVDNGGPFTAKIAVAPPVANDDVANATELSGETPQAGGSTAAATLEPGEPNHSGYSTSKSSAWHHWTAPANTYVTLDLAGSVGGTVAGIYTGAGMGALTLVARSADYSPYVTKVSFRANAGTTYRIAVGNVYAESGGTYSVKLTTTVLPANDDLAQATEVTGDSFQITGTTVGATRETGEPAHTTYTTSGAPSLWYRWTAPTSGRVILDYTGSFRSAVAAVYTGDAVNAVTAVAKPGDYVPYVNKVAFTATAGTTYRIAMSGVSDAAGAFKIKLIVPPANDNFADAVALTGPDDEHSGANVGGTREPSEPTHASWTASQSVWMTWQAAATGPATIDTSGSNFDTVLGIYTGSNVASLTPVVANDDFGTGSTSSVTFTATAGTVYRIAVDGKSAASGGSYKVNLVQIPPDVERQQAPAEEERPEQEQTEEEQPEEEQPEEEQPQQEEQSETETETDAGGGSEEQETEDEQEEEQAPVPTTPTPTPPAPTPPNPTPTKPSKAPSTSTAPAPAKPQATTPTAPPNVVTVTPAPAKAAPVAPRAKAPAPTPLSVAASVPGQKLAAVLQRGLGGASACSKACSVDVKVAFTPAGRTGRAASAVKAKARAAAGGQWVVKLSNAAKKRLRGARAVTAVVTISARSGTEVATTTQRVSLRR